MLPPVLAIAWTFWRRHRYGLLAVVAYVFTAGAASAALPAHFAPEAGTPIGAILAMPLMYAALYLMGVFSYGFEADVSPRPSCFPAELFRLPVRTGALAGWPMAFGAAAVGLLWLAAAWLILRPWLQVLQGPALPLWWPAMLLVAALAWLQALLWSGFGLPWLRVLLATVMLSGVVATAQISAASSVSEGALVGLFAGVAAIAWLVAYGGVRQARRGDVPNWDGIFRPLRRLARWRPRRSQPFSSAAWAQVWFEWRRTGTSLPLMTGLVVPFMLLPLFLGKNDVLPLENAFLGVLVIPVLFAGIAGTTVSGKNPWVKDYYGVPLFTATLPMTTAAMVAAKLQAAALSTLAAWAFVAVAMPLAVVWTGNLEEVAGWWRQAVEEYHPVTVVAGMMTAATLLGVWTWKRAVDSLLLGLTGRKWVIQGTIWGGMAALFILGALGAWIGYHPETHPTFLAVLPWLLGLLVLGRMLAAGWALRRVLRQGLLQPRTAVRWLAAWLLFASLLFGLLAWLVPAAWVPLPYLAFAVISVLPMVCLAAAPLCWRGTGIVNPWVLPTAPCTATLPWKRIGGTALIPQAE